jgi:hypothetical protein
VKEAREETLRRLLATLEIVLARGEDEVVNDRVPGHRSRKLRCPFEALYLRTPAHDEEAAAEDVELGKLEKDAAGKSL